MHAEFGRTDHQGVAHVVAGVADKDELHLIQRFLDAFLNGHDIGENLRGVIKVSQAVPHRDAGVIGEALHRFLLEATKFDAVKHAAKDTGRVFYGFFFAKL